MAAPMGYRTIKFNSNILNNLSLLTYKGHRPISSPCASFNQLFVQRTFHCNLLKFNMIQFQTVDTLVSEVSENLSILGHMRSSLTSE